MFRPYWAEFYWKLKDLPSEAPRHFLKSAELRAAGEEDAEDLWTVMERSFTTEQSWGLQLPERVEALRKTVYDGLLDRKVHFLVIEHGRRIIAGSGLIDNQDSPVQLASGIWVMEEYRCRGLGHYLLHASLKHLASTGIHEARAVTRSNTPAAKFLYPKFDSIQRKTDSYPELKKID